MSNILAGLYYDYSIPLGLHNILRDVIRDNQHDPNSPDFPAQRAPREWYSQPRPSSDTTTEVLQINFKLPLSVGHLQFTALRMPCTITAWYKDRNANWIPLTDSSNSPITLRLSYSASTTWYTYQTKIYPVVGTAIQLRITRTVDPQMGNNPFVVGIKETLIRRNVYTLDDTAAAIEDQQDVLGNTITSYVKHWGAQNAVDNNPATFWKSFPCPNPSGVVSCYLDTRDPAGDPQLIDSLYIDPTYTGSTLNLYYSNDPTVGTLIISHVSLPPDTQINANWTLGTGMVDASGPGISDSQVLFPTAFGPLVRQPVWIGVEWTPDFNPADGPPQNPILFSATPLNPVAAAAAGQYWPTIYYDVGAGRVTLEFSNGINTINYQVALTSLFTPYVPLQIVAGWTYGPGQVFLSVTSQNNTSLGVSTSPAPELPNLITLDGEAGYTNFRGTMTALVVKQELWTEGLAAFQANATVYANPNPVQPDSAGNYPSTSLDNAMLAVDWTGQQFPIGGTHESWYESKTWTPVFADYITQKGMLFLPQKTSMSYLKMEFTDLTAEPYPVYDQGIQVSYSVYPLSVINTATYGYPPGLAGWWAKLFQEPMTLQSDVTSMSIGSVNWFNPATIQNAINANWGRTQPPTLVASGPGTLSTSLPNTTQAALSATNRSEMNSPWVYPRQMLNPAYLAGQWLTGVTNTRTSNQTQQDPTNAVATQTANTFTPVTTTSHSNVLPVQGKDWWLFPGANLKMPGSLMRFLTNTQVVTTKGSSKAVRTRFTGNIIHRYDQATVTLDAAVAYFAGLTEVQAYATTYIASNDPPAFTFSQYDPTTFIYQNINQETAGPLTTAGSPYEFQNPDFFYPLELFPWTATGAYYWDAQHGPGSENGQGDEPAAAITADGNNNTLVSEPLAVSPGDQIVVSALVAYYGAVTSTPAAGGELSISGVPYYNGAAAAPVAFAMPTTATTYQVNSQAAMLASGATTGQSATITTGKSQGTYYLQQTPASVLGNWLFTGYGTLISNPVGNIDGRLFIRLAGTYTVPQSGVDHLAVSLNVGSSMTGGTVYWSGVRMNPAAGIEGTVYFNAVTTSTFADVGVKVNDSGLRVSDGMWAREDPLDTNINNLQLAPYVNTIPSVVPAGVWADTFAEWGDATIEWGTPRAEVNIQVDPNLIFAGNRAVHFTRAAQAGEAGLLVTQQTNMLSKELARLGCTFYKPNANGNQIIIRLRRVSDGVYIHEETFDPVVGYWFTYLTQFFELPDTIDQVYTIEFVATGDASDEIYLSDLFTNVAGARYFLQLGGSEEFLFDVTPLVYADAPSVSVTDPVNEMSLTVGIFNPDVFCYGISLTPRYLK